MTVERSELRFTCKRCGRVHVGQNTVTRNPMVRTIQPGDWQEATVEQDIPNTFTWRRNGGTWQVECMECQSASKEIA